MSAKHTPGPWQVMDFGRNDVRIAAPSDPVEPGCYVAQMFDWAHNFRDEQNANANLISAAPELLDAGSAQTAIIRSAQEILTRYLVPDGIDSARAISELFGLLDGPSQRAAQAKWDAAITKAEGV